jgi:N-acetylglucosamine-6-phosphate deacetylase
MKAVMEHRRHGTTSLVASLVTDSPEVLAQRVAMLVELAKAGELAGIHAEGPFLSDIRCGAQDPDKLQAPSPDLVERLVNLAQGYLATMTLAPELPGNVGQGSVTHALAARGAVPSYGHTDCTAAQMTAAVDDAVGVLAAPGARSSLPTATHLFNGMRPIHHRDPGPVLASLAAARRGRLVVELIADGTHLDPATVSEVFDLVGADSVALVTDAMAAAGMADGLYQLGPQAVRVLNGVARLERGDSIAGGTAHLLDVVRSTVQASGVSLALAVRSASLVPARVLGQSSEVGALKAGLRADLLLTDPALQPSHVIRAGTPVE